MGIIEEGKEIMDEYKSMPAAAQAVEHYEISRYGTLKTWANELGYTDAVKLLDATLKEEKNTDSTLSSWPNPKSTSMRNGASRVKGNVPAGCKLNDGNFEYDFALSSLSIATDRTERRRTSARRRISHPAMRVLRTSLRRAGGVEGTDISRSKALAGLRSAMLLAKTTMRRSR